MAIPSAAKPTTMATTRSAVLWASTRSGMAIPTRTNSTISAATILTVVQRTNVSLAFLVARRTAPSESQLAMDQT